MDDSKSLDINRTAVPRGRRKRCVMSRCIMTAGEPGDNGVHFMARLTQMSGLMICGFLLGGCSHAAPKEPINLAHVLVLGSPERDIGRQSQQGIQLALAEINQDDKGLLGRPL